MIKQLGVEFPRLCPQCIVETGRFDWRWSLAVVGRCRQHGAVLLDTCPACETPLEWKTALFDGCPHCQYRWDDHCTSVSFQPMSSLELAAWSAVSDPDAGRSLTRAVAEAIVTMARPYDSWHENLYTIPYTPNYGELVILAYRALSGDLSLMQIWAQGCDEKRNSLSVLGQQAVQFPLDALRATSAALDVLVPQPEIPLAPSDIEPLQERLAFVSQARRKQIGAEPDVLHFQVSFNELATVLGIPSNEVQFLVQDGPLKPMNSTSILRSQLFDLRDVSTLIETHAQGVHMPNPTVVTSRDPRLTEYFTRYGKLVAAILSGQLPGTYSSAQVFEQVEVDAEGLDAWLVEQQCLACQAPLSLHRVMAAFRCGEKTVRDLVKEGHFQWASWSESGGRDRVDGPSLLRYLTSA